MKFQFFRYFFTNNLLIALPDNESKDRANALQKIISQSCEFEHNKAKYVYRCCGKDGNIIHAKLGKKSIRKKSTPTENNFKEESEEDYPYCNIIFNCDDDRESGQRIAFEYKNTVFNSPNKALQALGHYINTHLKNKGYDIFINPIISKKTFWQIVDKYPNKIEKITFFYVVPNLFQLGDSLSEALDSLKDNHGATNAGVVLANKDGLKLSKDDEFLNQSIGYTSAGGGSFEVKIRKEKTTIKSRDGVITKEISITEINTNNIDAIKKIFEEK